MIFIDFIFLLCILFIRGSKRVGFRDDIPWIPRIAGIRRWLSLRNCILLKKEIMKDGRD